MHKHDCLKNYYFCFQILANIVFNWCRHSILHHYFKIKKFSKKKNEKENNINKNNNKQEKK